MTSPDSAMHYVYLLRSLADVRQRYVGLTGDLRARLNAHNTGSSFHTAKFRPWKLVAYIAFADKTRAAGFERYLKSGSGHAFAERHLWEPPECC